MSMTPGKATMFGLIGSCTLLGGLIALVQSGVGQGVDSLPPEARQVPDVAVGRGLGDALQQDDYLVVVERPLFNDDRRPAPPPVVTDCEPEDARPECDDGTTPLIEVVELDVTVRGIVITPEVKMVTLTDNKTKETMRIKEGMPLDGEYGSWTIASIEPRSVTFADQEGQSVPLDLEVHTKAMVGGKAPPPRTPVNLSRQAQQAQQAQIIDTPTEKVDDEDDTEAVARAARAEEIRRRVAERRAQLRQEAARRRESHEDGQR